jgi:hypothetical protein
VAAKDQHVLGVCCVFGVGLTVLADQLWLQQISMSDVCVVCLVLAHLWRVLLGVLVSVCASASEWICRFS